MKNKKKRNIVYSTNPDFEYEYAMANMNRTLDSAIETMIVFTRPEYSFIASRMVKEVASHPFVLSFCAHGRCRSGCHKLARVVCALVTTDSGIALDSHPLTPHPPPGVQ